MTWVSAISVSTGAIVAYFMANDPSLMLTIGQCTGAFFVAVFEYMMRRIMAP